MALCGLLFGADFSKVSNDDLAKMSGKVAPNDFVEYFVELHKRFDNMTKAEFKEFHKKIHEFKEKNEESMTLKELREQKAAILEKVREKVKSISKEECKNTHICDLYKRLRSDKKDGCMLDKGEKKQHAKKDKEEK